MKRLWKRLLDWWDPPQVAVEIEGFVVPERKCVYCGTRFEILAAEIFPGVKRIQHGCRPCMKKGIINYIWVEV